MSGLRSHVDEYLRLRRALGFKLKREGQMLPQFADYLEAAGAPTVTSALAISWAQLPSGVQPITWAHRLSAARAFARFMKTIDPATEVPPRDVFGARQRRPIPYLWSQEKICRLLTAARTLRPAIRAATHETLFGLLAVSGMRINEAIALVRDDVDLTDGVITIRHGKRGRSRLVPLHPTTTDALRGYAAQRDRLCPRPTASTFFLSSVGTTLDDHGVRKVFVELTTTIGIRTATTRPRMHDLRHSLALRTLIGWQRADVNIAQRMPALSNYLGHVGPAGTWWYLSASPELMGLAADRLDARFGGQR
jgi:site-specific recombinase XerD